MEHNRNTADLAESTMPAESRALMATLAATPLDAPTACADWQVRHVMAHLAAGAGEIADLIGDRLAGRPERPTRSFAEREGPFLALTDEDLWAALADQSVRKVAAVAALAARGPDA